MDCASWGCACAGGAGRMRRGSRGLRARWVARLRSGLLAALALLLALGTTGAWSGVAFAADAARAGGADALSAQAGDAGDADGAADAASAEQAAEAAEAAEVADASIDGAEEGPEGPDDQGLGDEPARSGTCGSCTWAIGDDGVLVIRPTSGESGTLADWGDGEPPWCASASLADGARVEAGVTALTCRNFFHGFCETYQRFDIGGLCTSQVTDMHGMFSLCNVATVVGYETIDTSNVTDMSDMFNRCYSLPFKLVEVLNTSNVTNMSGMFRNCTCPPVSCISGFDTTKVTDMSWMFAGSQFQAEYTDDTDRTFYIHALPDVSGFDTSQVETMESMFEDCYAPGQDGWSLLDLSGFDTSRVTNMSRMFAKCVQLESLDVSSLEMAGTDIGEMFRDCKRLETVDFGDRSEQVRCVTNLNGLFRDCVALTALDLSGFDTAEAADFSRLAYGCTALTSANLSGFVLGDGALATGAFKGCEALVQLVLPNGQDFAGCGLRDVSWKGSDGTAYETSPALLAGCAAKQEPADVTYAMVAGTVQLAGENRYETAARIALSAFPDGAEGAVVATGENFPDALSASSLAGLLGWPIVLTERDELTQVTREVLEALDVPRLVVVGGEAAVSEEAYSQLSDCVSGIAARVWGDDRYETARRVYAMGGTLSGGRSWGKDCIVATGGSYPDALSVSSYAYAHRAPIFLTDSSDGLDDAAKELVKAGGFKRAIVVGGTRAVCQEDEDWLEDACGTALRLSGDDRYATSRAIADFVLASGGSVQGACVATGGNFPDALAGSALAGTGGSVMLLAAPDSLEALGALSPGGSDDVTRIYFLGGLEAVPEGVRTVAAAAAGIA